MLAPTAYWATFAPITIECQTFVALASYFLFCTHVVLTPFIPSEASYP